MAALVAFLVAADALSRVNYLLFHSVVEGLAVTLGLALFTLCWSLRGLARDGFITVLGVTYLLTGLVSGLHLLAYPGVGVFDGSVNLAAQLWVSARLVEVVGLFVATLCIGRRPRVGWLLAAGGLGVSVLLGTIAAGAFPTCFVPGLGLTAFKVAMEYGFCAVLVASGVMLVRRRDQIDPRVLRTMLVAFGASIAAELCFTLFYDAFGVWNKFGHHLMVVSIFFVYRGILYEGVTRPFSTLFRAVEQGRQKLEQQVDLRTAELHQVADELRAEIDVRTRAEAAVRQSEQEMLGLIEELPQAIAVHREGRFVFVNAALSRVLGYEVDELLGSKILDVVHPDDADQVQARVVDMMRTGISPSVIEERFVKKDGSVVIAEVVALPLTFEGAPAALVAARDLTQEKALHARRMDMDRVITMGSLAAAVGHEINNPLSYVTANLVWVRAALQAGTPELPAIDGALAESQQGAERIRVVVAALQQVSRPIDDVAEHTLLDPVIQSALALAGNELRHRARLTLDLRAKGLVYAPAGRLGQVFLNLLLNAAHAIAAAPARDHEVTLSTWDGDGVVVAEVGDTGTGLPHGDPDRIFEPFYSTQSPRLGSGLGLSICREIVEANGGRLQARDRAEGGACFRVELPRSPVTPAAVTPAAVTPAAVTPAHSPAPVLSAASPPKTKPRVVVIDDDEMVGHLMQRMLRKHADVDIETDPHRALQALGAGPSVDLVFCDLMMPELSGMDLYRALQVRQPQLAARFVFITGGAFTPDAMAFVAEHADRVIAKPFSLKTLLSALPGQPT